MLPPNQYMGYFAPEFRLHVAPARIVDNLNTRAEVERIKNTILEQLSHLQHAPGVGMAGGHTLYHTTFMNRRTNARAAPQHAGARLSDPRPCRRGAS